MRSLLQFSKEVVACRRVSPALFGLLLFALTTASGLAAPSAEMQIVEAAASGEIKGVTSEAGKPARIQSQQPLPRFNLDPRIAAEIEPNANPAQATALTLGGNRFARVQGNIFANGDVDYYSFTGAAGDRVYSAVMTSGSSNGSSDSQLRLFGTDGTTLIEFDDDDGSFGGLSSSIAGASLPGAGTYFLEVRHFSATGQLRPYDLYLQLRGGSPTPEVEANDTPATANALVNGWMSGARDPALATEQDWFSFTANAGDTVFLSLDLDPERDNVSWNGRLGIGLFGDTDNQILTANDGNTGTVAANPASEAIFMTVKNTGTYFAFVDSATATTGGPTATYHLSVSVMPALGAFPGGSCTTYTSTDVPVAIPTGPFNVVSTLTVPGNPRIADLDVSIQLNHTRMVDLDVSLIAPGGNIVGLFTDIGASTTGGQTLMDTVFDDEAGITPLFTALRGLHVRPELNYSLGWFDGQNAGGTWTLDVRDDLAAEGGNLTGWSITVCEPPPPPVCPAGFAVTTVFSTDFETDAAGFTSSGTANEWERGTPSFAPIDSCNGGSNCFATDLDNTYDISSNQELLSPAFNLAGLSAPVVVRWAQKYQMEVATFDNYNVTAREVGNPTNAQRLFEWLGATMTNSVGSPAVVLQESAGWGQFTARADALAGLNGELAFNVATDSSVNFAGVAIDDVSITACRALSADLAITKTNGTTTSVPGQSTTYTIVASNAGPDPVTGATVADTFPASLTCTWTCVGAGGGVCQSASGSGNLNQLVNLPAGGSTTFTAICAINRAATGSLVNTATVSSSVTDPTPGNNSATDTDTLTPQADLTATLTDAPDPVIAGSNLTYTGTVINNGPSNAQAVSASLPLPAGTTFVSASATTGGICTGPAVGSNGTVTCSWAGATDGTVLRQFTAIAAVGVAATGQLSATVTVSSSTTDPTPGNNTATTTTTIGAAGADLSVQITASPAQVGPGQAITYAAVATNNGPGAAQNVQLTVTLGAGLQFSSLSVSAGGSCTSPAIGGGGSVVCNWPGATAAGTTRSVSVVAYSFVNGSVSATATASSATLDPTPGNNSASGSSVVSNGNGNQPATLIPTNHPAILALLAAMLGLIGFAVARRRG